MKVREFLTPLTKAALDRLCGFRNLTAPRTKRETLTLLARSYRGSHKDVVNHLRLVDLVVIGGEHTESLDLPSGWRKLPVDELRGKIINTIVRKPPPDGSAGTNNDTCDRQSPRTDQEIVADIIAEIETGVLPWRRPWSLRHVVIGSMVYSAAMWPSNVRAPRVAYGMYNGLLLAAVASTQEYRTNLWIAKEVVDELHAKILRGDSRPVALRKYPNNSQYGTTDRPRLVYNVDQVEDCEGVLGVSIFGCLEQEPAVHNQSSELRAWLEKHRLLNVFGQSPRCLQPSDGPCADAAALNLRDR